MKNTTNINRRVECKVECKLNFPSKITNSVIHHSRSSPSANYYRAENIDDGHKHTLNLVNNWPVLFSPRTFEDTFQLT